MALQTILDTLKTTLLTVTNIGKVYTYERLGVTPQTMRVQLAHTDNLIRYWTLSRQGTSEAFLTNRENLVTYDLRLRGYLEANDTVPTEPVFQNLLEAIRDLLRLTVRLESPPGTEIAELVGPLQVVEVGHRLLFGDALLVHYTECSLAVNEVIPCH